MAKISPNSIFHGASGKLGNFVFRTINGKTFVSMAPRTKKKEKYSGRTKPFNGFGRDLTL